MTNIETTRLNLRQFTIKDADFIYELLNSEPWLKYIGDRGIRTKEDAEKYIHEKIIKQYEEHGFGMLAVVEKVSGKIIGSCGLVKRDFLPHADLGFAFLPGFEGKGFGFESTKAIVYFSRDNLNMEKLLAITLENNIASISLLKKLGFKFEKNIIFKDGGEELQQYNLNLANC